MSCRVHPVLDQYDIIKKGDVWVFEKRGSYRPLFTGATKAAVVQAANEYMRNRRISIRVYAENGEIEDEWT
ncbi:MAG: DUF2188 domain-containing protein [Myxococcota bacterium]